MKVAIHQVNYLPWIGFFNKLEQVNKLVMYDIAVIHNEFSTISLIYIYSDYKIYLDKKKQM